MSHLPLPGSAPDEVSLDPFLLWQPRREDYLQFLISLIEEAPAEGWSIARLEAWAAQKAPPRVPCSALMVDTSNHSITSTTSSVLTAEAFPSFQPMHMHSVSANTSPTAMLTPVSGMSPLGLSTQAQQQGGGGGGGGFSQYMNFFRQPAMAQQPAPPLQIEQGQQGAMGMGEEAGLHGEEPFTMPPQDTLSWLRPSF